MENCYMKVEDVLRYLRIFNNPFIMPQYKITGMENHFFLCQDIISKIGASMFRVMECEVVQYMVEVK